MNVKWESVDTNTVELKVEVAESKVAEALDQAYKKVVKEVSLPGFRKGRVPRKMLEARFGVEVLYEDAVDILLPEAYGEAVEEAGIEPVDRPEIEDLHIEQGAPFTFTAKVTVKPQAELGKYKGIVGEKPVIEVASEEVEAEVAKMLKAHTRLEVSPDEEIKEGDIAVIDYEGLLGDEPFAGGSAQNHELEIGSGSFIPGFEEQLIGEKAGTDTKIKVTFPEEYHGEDLAGKDTVFNVKIHDIKRKVVPELNEDFVMEVSEFDTVAELKQDIKNKLEDTAKEQADLKWRNSIVSQVADNATIEVPQVMVDAELENMVNETRQNMMYSGIALEQYLEMLNQSMDEFKTGLQPHALARVKTDLVLEKIIAEEGLELSEDEVESKLEEMAQNYKQTPDALKKMLESRGLSEQVREGWLKDKAIDFLAEHAEVKLVHPQADEEVEELVEQETVEQESSEGSGEEEQA